ncbi:hypothetical protein [Gordonia terrae]|uniref:hypothetical protein n=1 Tax=Gordonia terrae TaxID=2055 RepID=UPI003F6A78A8
MRKIAILMACAALTAMCCIVAAGLALTWNSGDAALAAGAVSVVAGAISWVAVWRVRAANRRLGTNYTIFTI